MPSTLKRSNELRRMMKKDKVLRWALDNKLYSYYNFRIDELKRFCGIDRYPVIYFCPNFFIDPQYAKSKQLYFNEVKKRLKHVEPQIKKSPNL